ncbi:hypothetical protein PN462_11845 [Spirulina sp. CS-785/01]|uniref:hypothetical protein n=1 Tax=Spirulina sp. CS-785/01 TaxID=3021716 RepID=UPI002330C619|nr:hypothetical protein [Spirulina sp. CS-785/01]MDB9313795.1 hypothetical protein [Spirulina sp. CS-785/01]
MKTVAQKGLALLLASAAIAPFITATESVKAVEAEKTKPETLNPQTKELPIYRDDTYRDPHEGPWYERNHEYRSSRSVTKKFSGFEDETYPERYAGSWYDQNNEYRATKELSIHKDDTYRDPHEGPWYERNRE